MGLQMLDLDYHLMRRDPIATREGLLEAEGPRLPLARWGPKCWLDCHLTRVATWMGSSAGGP